MVAAALASLTPSPALAQAPAAAALSAADFLNIAQSMAVFEIEASQLALQRSQNPSMRSFANSAIDERSQLLVDLEHASRQAGLAMPARALMPEQQQMLDQLRAAPAGQFDAMYRQFQLAAHRDSVESYRRYATSGDLPILRETADRWWPCIAAHQEVLPPVYSGERG
jgi:putative membrane protein